LRNDFAVPRADEPIDPSESATGRCFIRSRRCQELSSRSRR
jgi:hypothetical protein